MPESAEHAFLVQELDASLSAFATTGLLGIAEAERRTFDYACLLTRDHTRPLVSQVCWGNIQGINEDLEMMLVGSDAPIKLYMLPDTQKARLRLDEALRRYRENAKTRALLRGFRYLALPSHFDADDEAARDWLSDELRRRIRHDLIFGIVFGQLGRSDINAFIRHGGPLGLKYAFLLVATTTPLGSFSDAQSAVRCNSKSSLRELSVLLNATKLLGQRPLALPWHPTIKGRLFIDLVRRMYFDSLRSADWPEDMKLVLSLLGLGDAPFMSLEQAWNTYHSPNRLGKITPTMELIVSAAAAKHYFGVDPLFGVDERKMSFYSKLDCSAYDRFAFKPPLTAEELGDVVGSGGA